MDLSTKTPDETCLNGKEFVAAVLLLAKKVTALNDPEHEEKMESLIDEYTEFLSLV